LYLRSLGPSEAKESFSKGLVDFLATRFSAVKLHPPSPDRARIHIGSIHAGLSGNSKSSPGISIKVFTQSNGLRVRYTMAYFPDLSSPLVLGAPTSPAEGWIHPGIWKFATDGPTVPLRFDSGDFPVPPLREIQLNI